ncbi:MAG TPA: NTP transferase domain-containing protein, partial [Clostridia bacterium]
MIIEGIILAAGFSSRAGAYKLTLDLGGKTVIERCIEGMYDTCSSILVVGGYQIKNLAPVLEKYSKAMLVYNKNFEDGMLSSIVEGFKHVKGDRTFMIPGDYPFVDKYV